MFGVKIIETIPMNLKTCKPKQTKRNHCIDESKQFSHDYQPHFSLAVRKEAVIRMNWATIAIMNIQNRPSAYLNVEFDTQATPNGVARNKAVSCAEKKSLIICSICV
jgi:hypothetical protein